MRFFTIFLQTRLATIKNWKLFELEQLPGFIFKDNSNALNPEHYVRQSLLVSRYLLFFLTSAFYLAGPPYFPVIVKFIVVLSFLAATVLAQNLYDNWGLMPLKIIIIETIGIAWLTLPTGGLDSGFVWYALNPIFAAAVYLPGFFCWLTLVLFIGTVLTTSMVFAGLPASPLASFTGHMGILLVFVMTTSLAQVVVSLSRRLGAAYTSLAKANIAKMRSLQHISDLYQALEAFSIREDSAELADTLAAYANKLCNAPAACFLLEGIEENRPTGAASILRVANQDSAQDSAEPEIDWVNEMDLLWNRSKPGDGLMLQSLPSETGLLVAVPVLAQEECFGLLAYLQLPEVGEPSKAGEAPEDKKQALIFLAGIAGIVMERLKTDKLWERLLVSEEQNRIANEIHDGVSQYLFSMVCALDTLAKEPAHLQEARIQEQLRLVAGTANLAARELRVSIYKLSPRKRGESLFVDNLAAYLDDLGRLNGTLVDLQAEGSEEFLSPALRKGLYRIVREASGNAVRHGKCSSLEVRLSMLPKRTVLEVKDDGCGYKATVNNVASSCKDGLGNGNMYQLAVSFNGDLEIQSEPGQGTLVRFSIPSKAGKRDSFKEAVF